MIRDHQGCRSAYGIVAIVLGLLIARPRVAHADDVDLVHALGADVTVSSVVQNAANRPEHLVDGSLDTAWNSRTGDLVGAWIELDLRDAARVASLRLTVGFTHATPRLDLFTTNQRITRVRVERNGAVVGTFPLDPEVRTLQQIPINGPGGVYRIVVAEVRAGSHRNWREICVSEVQAWGTTSPGAPHRDHPQAHQTPRGDAADALRDPGTAEGPFATLQAFCAAQPNDPNNCGGTGDLNHCTCDAVGENDYSVRGQRAWSGTVGDLREIRVFDHRLSVSEDGFCSLAVRNARGWWVFAEVIRCDPPYAAGGEGHDRHATIDRVEVTPASNGPTTIRMRYREAYTYSPANPCGGPAPAGSALEVRYEIVCTVPAGQAPSCRTPAPVGAPWID